MIKGFILSFVVAIVALSLQRFLTQQGWEKTYEQAVKAIDQLPLAQENDNEKGILIKTNQHGWVALVYTKDPDEGWTGGKGKLEELRKLATDTNAISHVKEALDQLLTQQDSMYGNQKNLPMKKPGVLIETNQHGWLALVPNCKDPSNGDGWQRDYQIVE